MHRAGLRLAILAMALQAVFLGTGGAVCLDAVPLPWLQVDCPDPCCDTDDGCCPRDPVPVGSGPLWPAPSDCCIRASVDYGLPGKGARQSADPAPAPARSLSPAPVPVHRYLNSATPSETLRPPPIRLVGVVLLQV
jgi:hypothetical protein